MCSITLLAGFFKKALQHQRIYNSFFLWYQTYCDSNADERTSYYDRFSSAVLKQFRLRLKLLNPHSVLN